METNGLSDPKIYHETVTANLDRYVAWTTPGLKIIRLRLLSDYNFPMWDVSYCHGQLPDGTYVKVDLPFDQLPKGKVNATIIAHAKADKLFAKATGIFDAISTLC